MRTDVDRDVAVDVLIVGGSVAALQIARTLAPACSVCVVVEPGVPYESYESSGRVGAGYDGTDLARVQAARRGAAWWREWAEGTGVPTAAGPSVRLLRPELDAASRRRWAEAGLRTARLGPGTMPPVLAPGLADTRPAYVAQDDLVLDPARVAAELRRGLESSLLAATVQRFRSISPGAIDVAELATGDGEALSVVPGFVVLAADAANASLLQKVAAGLRDRPGRLAAMEAARAGQVVHRRPTIVVRGDLPRLSLTLDELELTTVPGGDRAVTWVVQLPVDPAESVLGPDNLRFPPAVDPKITAEGVARLFELMPDVRARRGRLHWSSYVARETADPRTTDRPAPARVETLGMGALAAVWPSQLGFVPAVADVVAQRARAVVRPTRDTAAALPPDLPRPDPTVTELCWRRPGHRWLDWPSFARGLGWPQP